MAGTSWPALTAGLRARASDVESKFDWLEGSLAPMSGGSTTNAVHDLGTTTAKWSRLYLDAQLLLGTTTSFTTTGYAVVGAAMIGNDTSAVLSLGGNASSAALRMYNLGVNQPSSIIQTDRLTGDSAATIEFYHNNTGGSVVQVMAIGGAGSNVAIGTTTANTQVLLDISGTRALYFPRLSTAQRDALGAQNGFVLYNTTLSQFQAYENGSWIAMVGARIGVVTMINTTLAWSAGTTTTNWVSFTGSGRINQMQIDCTGHGGTTVINANVVADSLTIGTLAITALASNTAYLQPITTTGYLYGWSSTSNTVTSLQLDTYFRTSLVIQGVVATPPGGAVTAIFRMWYEHT